MSATGFPWFPALGAIVALLTFLASFPAIAKNWRKEYRIIDQIDRNNKAISVARSKNAIDALNQVNSVLALRFTALQLFPFPKWASRLSKIAQAFIAVAFFGFVLLLFNGFEFWFLANISLIYVCGFGLNLQTMPTIYRVMANRIGYEWSGGPDKFRPTSFAYTRVRWSLVPFPVVLAFTIQARMLAGKGKFPGSFSGSQSEAHRLWDRINRAEERYRNVIKKRDSRKLFSDVRKRAWRVRFEALKKHFGISGAKKAAPHTEKKSTDLDP